MDAAIRKYAKADSYFRGTAIVGNLTGKLLVVFIPGFGEYALPMAVGLQLLIASALELPTGFIGDRFGWKRAVEVGLLLKPVTTICMMLAALSAYFGKPGLAWFFIAADSVVDSLASSLLSGNIQSGALEWYSNQGGKGNLFLESQRHSFWLRFLIPLSISLAGFLVYLVAKNDLLVVATIIAGLFILRFKVYSEILKVVDEPQSISKHPSSQDFFVGIKHLNSSLLFLVFSSFTVYTIMMYFIGSFAKEFVRLLGLSESNALVGFCFMFLLVFVLQIFNKFIHPYLNKIKFKFENKLVATSLIVAFSLTMIVFKVVNLQSATLFIAILLALVMTSLAQAMTVMSQAEVHKSEFKNYSSTLISIGEMGATGLLGVLSLGLAIYKIESIEVIYLSLIVMLGLAAILTQRLKSLVDREK